MAHEHPLAHAPLRLEPGRDRAGPAVEVGVGEVLLGGLAVEEEGVGAPVRLRLCPLAGHADEPLLAHGR